MRSGIETVQTDVTHAVDKVKDAAADAADKVKDIRGYKRDALTGSTLWLG